MAIVHVRVIFLVVFCVDIWRVVTVAHDRTLDTASNAEGARLVFLSIYLRQQGKGEVVGEKSQGF